jgi:cytochrome c peroxidase
MDVGCTNCHSGAAVGGTMLQKFGVHADFRPLTGSDTTDQGRKQVTGAAADKDMFKVPGLRNVTRTAPYFHDGRVAELEKAIRVMGQVQLGKELTGQEVEDIKAFLEVLTGGVPATAAAP